MREIRNGLHHWSVLHENIGQQVSSYFYEPAAAVLDPKLPAEGLDVFEGREPALIVLSSRHHRRDCVAYVERFGARVLVHEAGIDEYADDPELDVEPYATGEVIAPGIQALEMNTISPDDAALALDVDGGALAFADSIVNYDSIGFVSDELIGGEDPDAVKRATAQAAAALLVREPDTLLFAHGDPIVGGGTQALHEFVQSYG